MKTITRIVFCFLVTFILLPLINAGAGDFQSKFKQRMNTTPAMNAAQYEPYYLSDTSDSKNSSRSSEGIGEKKEVLVARASQKPAELEASPIPASYAIYRTDYKAEMEEGVVTVKSNILFEVFRKGWTQIPLVRNNVGLIDAIINRGASFVTMQDGKYYLMIDKPGRYNLDMEFLIKANRERENGPGNFSVEVIPAPISQFEFIMPEENVEIFVDPSIKLELKRESKRTIAWAVMPNTNTISVRWTKALPKETITPVKLEPKIYVDTTTYAAIGEGVVRSTTNFNYSILQSEVPNFRIAFPEDISILDVRGNDLRDWKTTTDKGVQYLDVYLNFGVKGNYILNVSYERKIGEGSTVVQIPAVQATGVEREKGYFGIAAATNVELAVNKSEHVTPIDVKELPSSIWGSTTSPILLAFKYLKHPVNIQIDVTKHEELPVLVAAVDSASYITLQTDEGKNLTKAIYQVRNNVKQFIRLNLPRDAVLWSAFVAGKPVKPAKDKNGTILIPLEKSQLSGTDLAQFPVEIVYLDKTSKMVFLGNLSLKLPKIDIPISTLDWSVYLPRDFSYFFFGGDIKPARGHSQRSWVGSLSKIADKKGYSSKEMSQQVAQTISFNEEIESSRVKGVLPIKIDIPQQGQLFNFNKLLVTENESPKLSAWFVYAFKFLHGWFWLFVFIGGIVFSVKLIKKLKNSKIGLKSE